MAMFLGIIAANAAMKVERKLRMKAFEMSSVSPRSFAN
jgi:hypothetical protein